MSEHAFETIRQNNVYGARTFAKVKYNINQMISVWQGKPWRPSDRRGKVESFEK